MGLTILFSLLVFIFLWLLYCEGARPMKWTKWRVKQVKKVEKSSYGSFITKESHFIVEHAPTFLGRRVGWYEELSREAYFNYKDGKFNTLEEAKTEIALQKSRYEDNFFKQTEYHYPE